MLIAREAAEYAAEVLTPDAFYLPRTKGLFIKCVALLRVRGAVDEVILTANLKVPNIQEMRDYVGRVIVDTPSAGNIEGYCSTLLRYQHDRARLNFALKVLSDVTKTRPTGQAKPKT